MKVNLKVKVIGAGGIGGCLLDVLCRVLNYGSAQYSFSQVDVGIVDGDHYEERNKDRQDFRERGNKAEVTVKRLEELFPNLFFMAFPLYIDEGNAPVLIEDGDVVFLCVDNNQTRRLISYHCSELDNVTLISGGNDYTDGNVQVYIRKDGEDLLPPIHKVHKGIDNPPENDLHPNEVEEREGCLEEAQADPQLLIANNVAAALMLVAFHNWVDNPDLFVHKILGYDEVQFDMSGNVTDTKIHLLNGNLVDRKSLEVDGKPIERKIA
jgi:molybdopterin/thiamine biosynthesis adenylyltransferase